MDAVDDDTLQAVLKLWAADTSALPGLFAHPPRAGRLKSTRGEPATLPYAQIECEALPGKTVRYVKAIRKDCRKVTITMRGTRTQAVAALAAALALFNARLGAEGGRSLEYPSGARFIKWWPTNDGALKQEDEVREGQDVWAAVIEAEVYSVRAES